MKKFLYLLILTPSFILAQTRELDFEYFLYGLNHCHFEYSSRDFKNNQVDIFFETPGKEDLIAEYLLSEFEEEVINFAEIKRIDSAPNFKANGNDNLSQYCMYSELIKDGLKRNFSDPDETGKLDLDNQKINSFITGAFLRNGTIINDTIYEISSYVSSKAVYCYAILKNSSSTNVVYSITSQDRTESGTMINPTSTVYFNPSSELKEYIELVDKVPSRHDRYIAYFADSYHDKMSNQNGKKEKKNTEKEFNELKKIIEEGELTHAKESIDVVKELLSNIER